MARWLKHRLGGYGKKSVARQVAYPTLGALLTCLSAPATACFALLLEQKLGIPGGFSVRPPPAFFLIGMSVSPHWINSGAVVTMAPRSSVTLTNQVFAAPGGRGAIINRPSIFAGKETHSRFERIPVSAV